MFKNYLKVALRNLWKNKAFSAINIIGLATGLAVCLLIVLYVVDELSYDKYNKNADRIYRLDADIYFNDTQAIFAVAPDPLALTLKGLSCGRGNGKSKLPERYSDKKR